MVAEARNHLQANSSLGFRLEISASRPHLDRGVRPFCSIGGARIGSV